MGATVSISAPDPRFQKARASVLSTARSSVERSPTLGVSYIVPLLTLFVVGLGVVMTFARAEKGTARMQPDPIPAKGPKGVLKVVSIGACILVIVLVVSAALGRSVGSEGGDAYALGQ
jgi:hypothetical protein